ncbi:MAG: glycosyltransferase [Muribaculaceae bacterium]|nr:glycosyltransferase [Muribaculaceae bacterium]
MNILFLTENDAIPEHGGVERVTSLLSRYLKEKFGHAVMTLSLNSLNQSASPKDKFLKILKENRVDVIINQNLIRAHFRLLQGIPPSIKIVSVLHNRPFQHENLGVTFKRLSYPSSCKEFIMKLIGLWMPSFYIGQRLKASRKNLNKFLAVSDRLVVLCEKYKERIIKFMPEADTGKILAIPNPNTYNLNLSGNNDEKENIVLFVGRLAHPQKNVTGFIDIWKRFNDIHPDWKAIIVGDGPHDHQIKAYARKCSVRNLIFMGNKPEISDFYKQAKILCITSLYEGWPMVIPEAVSFGCLPVMYDSFEATLDLFPLGYRQTLVVPYNEDKMLETLLDFATDDKKRDELTSRIQKHITRYDITFIGNKWNELLQTISSECF